MKYGKVIPQAAVMIIELRKINFRASAITSMAVRIVEKVNIKYAIRINIKNEWYSVIVFP